MLQMNNDFLYAYHNVDFIINLKIYQLLFDHFQPIDHKKSASRKFKMFAL